LRKLFVIALAAAAVLITAGAILMAKFWPFSAREVLQDLGEASDSQVTARSYHPTYFPIPGCVLEGVEFRHGDRQFRLITIDRLRIEGSYAGILRQHVPQIKADGARVFIPPFGYGTTFQSRHSQLVIDELTADGSSVEFLSDDPQQPPMKFEVHDALLTHVQWGSPIHYQLKFRNPNPPGEIAVTGNFGPWADGHHEDTPMSGDYMFTQADLSTYAGISGILSSQGKFDGVLKHVNISGTTDTPDFKVDDGGPAVRLQTKFDAYVDATHGDTFLHHVEARFGRTTVIAEGSVAGAQGKQGKQTNVKLASHHGRIEDILGLFTTDRPPMSGDVSLQANAKLPSGDAPFLQKVRLDGAFGIDEGNFTAGDTQRSVNELSAGARGQNKEDPETVMTDLKGQVNLIRGVSTFSDLRFGVPGAKAHLHGTYNIINYRIDLHGMMKVDTKISKTSSGMKSFFLKMMDPIFKKKKTGEIVPVHIIGTYQKPGFGLDLANGNAPKASPQHR
jgi:AsmA-like C-terminal region